MILYYEMHSFRIIDVRIRIRNIYSVIFQSLFQTQETSAKTISGRCRRGHLSLVVTICCDIAERISFAEHGKLVAESSEFQLMLIRAHKAHFFKLEICKKKQDILSEKRESGMALKKREFTSESGNVDTYVMYAVDFHRIVNLINQNCMHYYLENMTIFVFI